MPVYLDNLNRILPKGESLPVPMLSRVIFGPPAGRWRSRIEGRFLERRASAASLLKRRRVTMSLMSTIRRPSRWLIGGIVALLVVASAIGWVLHRRTTSDAGRRPSTTSTHASARGGSWRRSSRSAC